MKDLHNSCSIKDIEKEEQTRLCLLRKKKGDL